LLERIVVERLTLAWLRVGHIDTVYPEAKGKTLAMKAAAERDFRTALRNLELVRTKLHSKNGAPGATEPADKKKDGGSQNGQGARKRRRRKTNTVPVNRISEYFNAVN
jgi:hypothetical protein